MEIKQLTLTITIIFFIVIFLWACKKEGKSALENSDRNISYSQDISTNAQQSVSEHEIKLESKPEDAIIESVTSNATIANTGKSTKKAVGEKEEASLPKQPENKASGSFALIKGGTFTMGSPDTEQGHFYEEEPQHTVTVSSFYIGKYEVTQQEWAAVMGNNPSNFKGDNFPVEEVSWFDAIEYCNKRSQKEGLTPAYRINGANITWIKNTDGYRLPTEAEWEFACRSGTITPFFTGENITTNQANYDGNNPYYNNPQGVLRQTTTVVGSFPPNHWGLYDMHGNVWEWCWDWFGSYSSNMQNDPIGPFSGEGRVIRGGAWNYESKYLRSASRLNFSSSARTNFVGFRLVHG